MEKDQQIESDIGSLQTRLRDETEKLSQRKQDLGAQQQKLDAVRLKEQRQQALLDQSDKHTL